MSDRTLLFIAIDPADRRLAWEIAERSINLPDIGATVHVVVEGLLSNGTHLLGVYIGSAP